MGYKIFANLTIGTENLSSAQKAEVVNYIHQKYDVLPLTDFSNQWLFPIEACFHKAHEVVQIALAELALKLNLDKLVYTLNFSAEMWKMRTLTIDFTPTEDSA